MDKLCSRARLGDLSQQCWEPNGSAYPWSDHFENAFSPADVHVIRLRGTRGIWKVVRMVVLWVHRGVVLLLHLPDLS